MLELIEIIFQRLGALAPVPLSPQGAGRAEVSCCCALAAPAALCRHHCRRHFTQGHATDSPCDVLLDSAVGMHTGAAARMTASPLASDIAAGSEACSNPMRTLSATSVSNGDAPTAQPAAPLDRGSGATSGRGTPQQGPGQHSLGMQSPTASQSSMSNAQSSALQEGSGTRAASKYATCKYVCATCRLCRIAESLQCNVCSKVHHEKCGAAANMCSYILVPYVTMLSSIPCSARLDWRTSHCVSGSHQSAPPGPLRRCQRRG